MFHMGWFIGRGYSVHAWNRPWSGTIGTDYMQPDLYIDLVRAMETEKDRGNWIDLRGADYLAVDSGMRWGELVGLRRGRVDLSRVLVLIPLCLGQATVGA